MMVVNISLSFGLTRDIVYTGNLLLLDTLIRRQQLMDFNPAELRLLRNMIYARHNYRFRSDDLQAHFSRFEWFNGTEDNIENILTYIDHRNISTILTLEKEYPLFIPFNDQRIFDTIIGNDYSLSSLFIMGWSEESKLLVGTNRWADNRVSHFRIYDLKQNEVIWEYWIDVITIYFIAEGCCVRYNEIIDNEIYTVIEIVKREFNILPVADYTLTQIEGFSVFSNEIRYQRDPRYAPYYYWEVGLENNSDGSTITLGDIHLPWLIPRSSVWRFTEDDIWYLGLRSPFDANIIALIAIIPAFQPGHFDIFVTEHRIFGIYLNEL